MLAHADGRPVVEVGSGPGHVTAYLSAGGADATGIDLSAAMVAEARRRFPGPAYEVGDLRRLSRPATSSGWAAVLAWYSLIHLAASELPDAVAALVRPLDPGGWLVLGLHAGAEVRHLDDWFGHDVQLDFVLHEPAYVVGWSRPPAWSTSSGTCAGRSPPGGRRASGCTSSAGSRVARRTVALTSARVRLGSMPCRPTAPAWSMSSTPWSASTCPATTRPWPSRPGSTRTRSRPRSVAWAMPAMEGSVSLRQAIAEVLRACGTTADERVLDRLVAADRELVDELAVLHDDVVPFLESLRERGVRTAFVSNCAENTRPLLDRLGLTALVDELVLSCEVRAVKPDPAIFDVAVDRLGVRPGESLFVDDQPAFCRAAEAHGHPRRPDRPVRRPGRRVHAQRAARALLRWRR